MDYITIDTKRVPIEGENNILSLIRKAGIDLPTFCYHSELSIYGACRMCVVEDDRGRIFASCSEQPRPGMVIYTNTKKIQSYRRLIIELLLSSHCRDCTTCQKNGKCSLQELAYRVGVHAVRFLNNKKKIPLDMSSPSIVRDPNKCILCGDCVRTCDEIQGIGAIDFAFRGSDTQVMPAFNRALSETNCVGCGQCAVVCPTAAISVRTNVTEVWDAITDPAIRVVAQIAPAVRVAIGESFHVARGENSFGKLVAALRVMGFDEIYDTSFAADLTVMEESKELAERLEKSEKLPLFTSCCPGWVKYCENHYPEFTDNISTCRSPQGMFSPLIKDYFKEKDINENKKTIMVSIMPCTAKKGEILRPDNFTDGKQDTDYVITTQEVIRMIKQVGIQFEQLEEEAADMPFAVASGGGTIFGATGGVTEAVLRKLAKDKSYQNLKEISYIGVRGEETVKETTVTLGDREVKIAVVHGLAETGRLLERIKAGEVSYDFVEVMACRRGCIMGGGQPPFAGDRTKKGRMDGLYKADVMSNIRYPDENPVLNHMYQTNIKGKEHKLFHRNIVK
ncbi:[FeFe] hydrogenase, group A [Lachnotalea glycerini]|uniref:Ferredoxin n=1 Tax=Lachnotalea glycerini TaxID=1763509 RepID=A0A371J9S9_9FIRM|nr:[FeFe] hydrogenase, group A [Lachnotalea glycerini]RDY29532.1 ferredoxin [Lachnotalea glycerini]